MKFKCKVGKTLIKIMFFKSSLNQKFFNVNDLIKIHKMYDQYNFVQEYFT